MKPTRSLGEGKNMYLSAARKNDVHPSTRVLAATVASDDSTPELLASLSCWLSAARGYALKIARIWSEKSMTYHSYKQKYKNRCPASSNRSTSTVWRHYTGIIQILQQCKLKNRQPLWTMNLKSHTTITFKISTPTTKGVRTNCSVIKGNFGCSQSLDQKQTKFCSTCNLRGYEKPNDETLWDHFWQRWNKRSTFFYTNFIKRNSVEKKESNQGHSI